MSKFSGSYRVAFDPGWVSDQISALPRYARTHPS
jgi:hypothetical protein